MKPIVFGIAAAAMLVGVAGAQTTTTNPNTTSTTPVTPNAAGTASTTPMTKTDDKAAASGNTNQAVATTNANASEPARGANSFTMGEAKSRLEKNGFADVSDLKKDDNGVWRGTGKKDGSAASVWLDYKGNTGTASN
jgi:protein CpxP